MPVPQVLFYLLSHLSRIHRKLYYSPSDRVEVGLNNGQEKVMSQEVTWNIRGLPRDTILIQEENWQCGPGGFSEEALGDLHIELTMNMPPATIVTSQLGQKHRLLASILSLSFASQ